MSPNSPHMRSSASVATASTATPVNELRNWFTRNCPFNPLPQPVESQFNDVQMYKCRLSFKSFHSNYIKCSIRQICQAIVFWKIPLHSCSFNNLPIRRKKYTFLRSPHVHKKSREQFEWSRKKGEIVLDFLYEKHLLLLLFWLENARFPGVELMITLHYSTALPTAQMHCNGESTSGVHSGDHFHACP